MNLNQLKNSKLKTFSSPFSDSCLPDKKAMAVPAIQEVKKILIINRSIIDELVKSHIPYVVHASTSSARTEYQ